MTSLPIKNLDITFIESINDFDDFFQKIFRMKSLENINLYFMGGFREKIKIDINELLKNKNIKRFETNSEVEKNYLEEFQKNEGIDYSKIFFGIFLII